MLNLHRLLLGVGALGLKVAGLLALVADTVLRLVGAVLRQVSVLAAVVALLALSAVAGHVARIPVSACASIAHGR